MNWSSELTDFVLYRMILHGRLYSELMWVRLMLAAAEHLSSVSSGTTCVSNLPPHDKQYWVCLQLTQTYYILQLHYIVSGPLYALHASASIMIKFYVNLSYYRTPLPNMTCTWFPIACFNAGGFPDWRCIACFCPMGH